MALGDVVKVKGTTKNYSNLLEFDPVITVERISSGTVPVPDGQPPERVAPTQGKLIQVQGAITSYTAPPYPMTGNWSFRINDGSGELTIYVYRLSGLDMRGFEVGQQIRIIGLSGRYSTTIQVHPRYQTDVIDLRPPEVVTAPIRFRM